MWRKIYKQMEKGEREGERRASAHCESGKKRERREERGSADTTAERVWIDKSRIQIQESLYGDPYGGPGFPD